MCSFVRFTDNPGERLNPVMRLLLRGLTVASVRVRSISLRRVFLAVMLLYLLLIRMDPGKNLENIRIFMHSLDAVFTILISSLRSQLFPQHSLGYFICTDSCNRRGIPCSDHITKAKPRIKFFLCQGPHCETSVFDF